MLTLFIFKWVDFAFDLNKLLLCKLSSNKLCACFTILVSLKNSFFKKDKNWGPLTTAITSVPHKNLALDLEQPQQVKEVTVGCNWAKLHTPTQVVHQTSVSTWVPLTSARSSFEAKDPVEREGKTHKENRVNLSPAHRASVPATGEQTLLLKGWWLPLSREEVLPHALHSIYFPIISHTSTKVITITPL